MVRANAKATVIDPRAIIATALAVGLLNLVLATRVSACPPDTNVETLAEDAKAAYTRAQIADDVQAGQEYERAARLFSLAASCAETEDDEHGPSADTLRGYAFASYADAYRLGVRDAVVAARALCRRHANECTAYVELLRDEQLAAGAESGYSWETELRAALEVRVPEGEPASDKATPGSIPSEGRDEPVAQTDPPPISHETSQRSPANDRRLAAGMWTSIGLAGLFAGASIGTALASSLSFNGIAYRRMVAAAAEAGYEPMNPGDLYDACGAVRGVGEPRGDELELLARCRDLDILVITSAVTGAFAGAAAASALLLGGVRLGRRPAKLALEGGVSRRGGTLGVRVRF